MCGQSTDAATWLPILSPVFALITGLGAVALSAWSQRGNERRKHFETMRMEAYSDLMRGLATELDEELNTPGRRPNELKGIVTGEVVSKKQSPLVNEAIARIILYGSRPVLDALEKMKETEANTEANWEGFLELLLSMRKDGFPHGDPPSKEQLRIVLGLLGK